MPVISGKTGDVLTWYLPLSIVDAPTMAQRSQQMIEPYTTLERWAEYFNAENTGAVVRLYTADAMLWGTLSQDITASTNGIKVYFENVARLGLTVKLGAYSARTLAPNTACVAGHYDLFRVIGGSPVLFPARYSVVLIESQEGWLIAQHHSSLKPQTGASFER